VLGVDEDASAADIRHAYKTLMLQYHPDKSALSTVLLMGRCKEDANICEEMYQVCACLSSG
jgi:DnaJ-class molecular chaperone